MHRQTTDVGNPSSKNALDDHITAGKQTKVSTGRPLTRHIIYTTQVTSI